MSPVCYITHYLLLLLLFHSFSLIIVFFFFVYVYSDYDNALTRLRTCLTLAVGRRKRASVLSSMAYIHHIIGDYFTALDEYHKSLALRPEIGRAHV